MPMVVQDIRALLWQFKKAGLKDFYWRKDDLRLFLARPDGAPNPMLATGAITSLAAGSANGCATGSAAATEVMAPHLGLFEPCCAVGDTVASGAVVARIDVLGRKTDVVASIAGRIGSVGFAPGGLVEFGDCLLELTAA